MNTAIGYIIDDEDDHWEVFCPVCNKRFEYEGFFDEEDDTKGTCGNIFTTEKLVG